MSITLKDLREYRAICGELIQRQKRLAEDRRHVNDAVQSAADFPYSLHTVPIEGDVYDHPPLPQFTEIAALRRRKQDIEEWVSSIHDYTVRRIIEIYYLMPAYGEKPTWEQVADGLNDGSTGDACRKRFARYMSEKK